MARAKWRGLDGLWRNGLSQFTSAPTGKIDLRNFPKRSSQPDDIIRPKGHAKREPAPAPIEIIEEPTPRDFMEEWAGVKAKARRKRVPAKDKKVGKRARSIGSFSSKGMDSVGNALARSKVLSVIQTLRAGTRIRITVRGQTSEGLNLKAKERRREYLVRKGGPDSKADQLLGHLFGALGKEFFDARGRGYDMINAEDTITWEVFIVPS